MGNITIRDIAREAGVSISTVSNALNGVNVLKPETRDHILEVADRLHYIPNLNGKNLKSKATRVLGLFVTSLKGPYFATLVDAMYWECMKYGYELNIFVTWEGKSTITNILGRRVDGCVILSSYVNSFGESQIQEVGVPTIFLDRELGAEKISSVIFDSYKDGEIIADYLIERGITKISFIQGVLENYDAIQRMRGLQERLAEEGITIDPQYVLRGEYEREVAYNSVQEFLEKGLPLPEVFVAANDLSAIGCMDKLKEAGYRIPEDVMVIGVDDIELGRWYKPTLTTVKTCYERQAIVAVEKLVKMINNEETGEVIRLHDKIIERESTARTAQ